MFPFIGLLIFRAPNAGKAEIPPSASRLWGTQHIRKVLKITAAIFFWSQGSRSGSCSGYFLSVTGVAEELIYYVQKLILNKHVNIVHMNNHCNIKFKEKIFVYCNILWKWIYIIKWIYIVIRGDNYVACKKYVKFPVREK